MLVAPPHPPSQGKTGAVVYARYSTDEQNPSSIQDQVDFVQRFLTQAGVPEREVVVRSDEGISGEIVARPGIDEV